MVSDLKRKVIYLLDQVFPEYSRLFSDTFGKSSIEILTEYSTPEEFLNVDTNVLAETLATASKGRLGFSKAEQIKDVAANSFGTKLALDTFSFQIKQLIEQIKFIEEHITELEEEISKLLKKLDTPIETIPGIVPTVASFNDPVLSAYYNKKREEGKHHFTAIGAVARKLLYIIHAVLRNNKPYAPIA